MKQTWHKPWKFLRSYRWWIGQFRLDLAWTLYWFIEPIVDTLFRDAESLQSDMIDVQVEINGLKDDMDRLDNKVYDISGDED